MWRRILWGLAAVIALPLAYGLASVGLALVPGPAPDLSGPPAFTIGLIQGPIHTDILVPLTPATRARFGFAARAGVPVGDPGAQWLVYGWGAAEFYTTTGTLADITPAQVLAAANGDSAVIRLDVLGPLPALPNLRLLPLSETQFRVLMVQLSRSLASETPLDHPGFTGSDAFFPGRGRFHALRTCNVWLGEMLRAAGVPFGLWTPANWSVTLALDWHAAAKGG